MSKRFDAQDATEILATAPGVGHLIAYGISVPGDGAKGYAPGCLFLHTDGATLNTVLYVNISSASSCDFDAILGAAG